MPDDDTNYQATDASGLVGEIFGGGLSIPDAVEKLRARLLDLTTRNRLLSYRFPKGRCIPIVGTPNYNQVFEKLTDGGSIRLLPVSDPPANTYQGKKPEVRSHAEKLGISTSQELAPASSKPHTSRRLNGLQVLLYPSEMDRLVRKIANVAKTAIEETGSNMLYLIVGYLEFYDSDNSDKPMLAPLLSLPATLVRGPIDRETRTYQWSIQHSGEDLNENATLREKLKQFPLHLPEMQEDEEPEAFFARVEKAISKRRRWKVRRQLTVGMLSFGKLAVWADLDTAKHPELPKHPQIANIFNGGEPSGDGGSFAPDYRVDERPDADVPLIYDADSSQHSAIIDVMAGKNMVINGPPGTGKSQTITNLIAAALTKGETVLFVSEKLAALEVVRHRLNQANLGHFCLELHSHKTQKKKFIEDISDRLDQNFRSPRQFNNQLATLVRLKQDLAKHVELMASKVGNALDLTIQEIFWACERRRSELGDLAAVANRIELSGAAKWSLDQIRLRREQVEDLADLWSEVSAAGQPHPWEGFHPKTFIPGDDISISNILVETKGHLAELISLADRLADLTRDEAWSVVSDMQKAADRLQFLPEPPDSLIEAILPELFPEDDPKGQRSKAALNKLRSDLTEAQECLNASREVLSDGHSFDVGLVAKLRARADDILTPEALKMPLERLSAHSDNLRHRLEEFLAATGPVRFRWAVTTAATVEKLGKYLADVDGLDLSGRTISELSATAAKVTALCDRLKRSLDHLRDITERKSLSLDERPFDITRLLKPDGIEGLVGDGAIGESEIAGARTLLASLGVPRSSSLDEIGVMIAGVRRLEDEVREALRRCIDAAEHFGIRCDGPASPEEELRAVIAIARGAPFELLRHRHPNLGDRGASATISKVETAIRLEAVMRAELEEVFHIDAVPPVNDLKAALAAFRRGDRLFNFLSSGWRRARKTFNSVAKERRKRKAAELAQFTTKLLAWIDHRESFLANREWPDVFGGLFEGFETDVDKARKLHAWYVESHSILVASRNLFGRFNLTTVDSDWLEAVAARADHLGDDIARLERCESQLGDLLGIPTHGFQEARTKGWQDATAYLESIRRTLGEVVAVFGRRGKPNLSPARILELMEAALEIERARPEIEMLAESVGALRKAGGPIFQRQFLGHDPRLPEVFGNVEDMATKVDRLVRLLAEHVDPATTVTTAMGFIIAKHSLEQAISNLAAGDECGSQSGIVDFAKRVADVSGEVVAMFRQAVPQDRSARDAFIAVSRFGQGEDIITDLSTSPEMIRFFGPALQGYETNGQSIADTHAWGAKVASASLPPGLVRLLLSPEARPTLSAARSIHDSMSTEFKSANAAILKLSTFGSFDGDGWFRHSSSVSEILKRVDTALNSTDAVAPLSRWLAAKVESKRDDVDKFVGVLEKKEAPPAAMGAIFELAAYLSVAKSICRAVPEITRFNGKAHTRLREDFKELDRKIIAATGRECARQIDSAKEVPEGNRGVVVSELTEMNLLRHEINKQKRHIPIRQLVTRAGTALQALKPCFMMGPLSVAQYLAQGTLKFDLVIMDEASQLRPEDALGAIARGSQLIVVGDPKQLPPTNFFDKMADGADDEDEDSTPVIHGMESILDICQQIFTPIRSLRWHYRSQHESLIAYSNHYFYKNLVVFPSPHLDNPRLGIKWRYVRDGLYEERRNFPEAKRIADAVVWHMTTCPEESLGVVTLNGTQRDLVEELLELRLRSNGKCQEYVDRWQSEGWPFFIKNLENVQGDERDCILISTTFGKPKGSTKVRQNFGPISRSDGWRRLNVLFTRAKRRVELFTSMRPEDIVVDNKTPAGTRALRDYLDYAKRGILTTTDESGRPPDSDFEVAVMRALAANGYEVRPQLGVAGYFLDLAVRNPDRPGEWLAAIECDGAMYHSGLSVRDRDRIRQEILESLGWKGRIYRIWSTDWFYNPLSEIAKLTAFLSECRDESSRRETEEPVLFPWEKDSDEEFARPVAETASESVADADKHAVEALREDEAEAPPSDLFVEVGDRVTYCFADNPSAKMTVMIVDSASNPKLNIVNENTPLAQALLGLSQGEEGDFVSPDRKARSIRVLKVER